MKRLLLALACTLLPVTVLAQNTRVDLLVVYTPACRAYYGGTSGVQAHINASVAAANTAYTNSGIAITLNLVGTAETNYTEPTQAPTDMSVDLGRLQNSSDGYMDEVHGLRTQYGADLVCLFRRDQTSNAAGIGYLNAPGSNGAYAFCVVADWTAISNNTFAHELGHNQGSHHANPEATSGGAYSYSYGHRFNGTNGTQYRTVMAYAPGSRISYFSNPDISYQGTATGTASANNALSHNNMKSVVAAWKATTTPSISAHPGSRTAVASYSTTFSVTATGPSLTYQWRKDGSSIGGATSASYTIASVSNGDAGAYSVVVSNDAGSATSSNATLTVAPSVTASGTKEDINGDGSPDLVFQNTSDGQRAVWYMSGTTRIGTATFLQGTAAWQIQGLADFSGDGRPDLLFVNSSTGERCIWVMNGVNRISVVTLPTGVVAWKVGGVGDFNGDGHQDIAFYNTSTGERSMWLMNRTTRSSAASLGVGSTAWVIGAAGDFNADGKDDLVFYNTSTGERAIWMMNGTTRSSVATLPTGTQQWVVSAACDFNGDGKTDLAFMNTATGARAAWLMNGTTRTAAINLPTGTTAWDIRNR